MFGCVLNGLALPHTHAEDFYPVVPALTFHSWWQDREESQWRVSVKCHGLAACKRNVLSVTETRITVFESLGILDGSEVIWKHCQTVACETDMQAHRRQGHSRFQKGGILSDILPADLLCMFPPYSYPGHTLLLQSPIDFSGILHWRKALHCCWGVQLWLKEEYWDVIEKDQAMSLSSYPLSSATPPQLGSSGERAGATLYSKF